MLREARFTMPVKPHPNAKKAEVKNIVHFANRLRTIEVDKVLQIIVSYLETNGVIPQKKRKYFLKKKA